MGFFTCKLEFDKLMLRCKCTRVKTCACAYEYWLLGLLAAYIPKVGLQAD